MTRRRPVTIKGRTGVRTGSKQTRIRIPQPKDRPIRLVGRDNLRWKAMRPESWWFVLHRKGVYQPNVGMDPLEARAVSKESVNGTLPERIVYKYLISKRRFKPDGEFSFQSSLQGGRLELGGIVADFLFPYMRIVIQVQGPTHKKHLRMAKDAEQKGALELMGFRVFDITDDEIYNEARFEQWMNRVFGGEPSPGGWDSGGEATTRAFYYNEWDVILDAVIELRDALKRGYVCLK